MVDKCLSSRVSVQSGVVQGSVLGPLLFILFIDDVTHLLDAPATCQLYADDMKLYSTVELSNHNSIASSLLKLKLWSENWQLGININKCSVMHLCLKNPGLQYCIGSIALPNITSFCDLGITYNDKISFREHIDLKVAKAYQRIYLIFRGFVSRNISLLKQAYVTYVRPLLEYCTPVWSPYLIKDNTKIENVQEYFTRRLFPQNTLNYTDRLKILNLESLEQRRLKFDLKMYFQIIHGLVNLDKDNFLCFFPKLTVLGATTFSYSSHYTIVIFYQTLLLVEPLTAGTVYLLRPLHNNVWKISYRQSTDRFGSDLDTSRGSIPRDTNTTGAGDLVNTNDQFERVILWVVVRCSKADHCLHNCRV